MGGREGEEGAHGEEERGAEQRVEGHEGAAEGPQQSQSKRGFGGYLKGGL